MTALLLHPMDNIAIARAELPPGAMVEGIPQSIISTVPAGHKVAVTPIAQGERVRRYGQIIGVATLPIQAGDHVHSHNMGMCDHDRSIENGIVPLRPLGSGFDPDQTRSFMGIRRPDGRVATRNYVGVISTVNCSASVAKKIAQHFQTPLYHARFPNVDGVVALTHGFGCGIDHAGDGIQLLQRTLAGYLHHANFAGVILVGLGCETNQMSAVMLAGNIDPETITAISIQQHGGTRKAIEAGIKTIEQLLPDADRVRRILLPLSHLALALQCGGSDGYSGITANPALGVAVDLLVAHGGTAILSETPEIYGAEHLLAGRAIDPSVAAKLLDRIKWWERYAKRESASLDNNPTPGNKAGGLTTILEKSLGALAKSGSSSLRGVYHYAEPINQSGLVFMDAPGYDPISATGQIASGANIIAFTTRRGSCFGAKPVPTVKISSNSSLYQRMPEDMDINCGSIMDGNHSVESKGKEIFEKIILAASGEKTNSERADMGNEEFVPWMTGAQL